MNVNNKSTAEGLILDRRENSPTDSALKRERTAPQAMQNHSHTFTFA